MMEEKTVFTTKETAKYLGISQSTIYRMEKQGLISSIRTPGGQRRFSKEAIEEYLKRSQKMRLLKTSKYKKLALFVKEPATIYTTDDKQVKDSRHTPTPIVENFSTLVIEHFKKN